MCNVHNTARIRYIGHLWKKKKNVAQLKMITIRLLGVHRTHTLVAVYKAIFTNIYIVLRLYVTTRYTVKGIIFHSSLFEKKNPFASLFCENYY